MHQSINSEKVLLWVIKSIIFIIPILPLYISPSLVFPYISGKNFAFRILVEIAGALWLALIFLQKEYRYKHSPVSISILIFTFIVGLADLMGVNPYKSFWSNYQRMEGYITILHLALYFMIIQTVLRSRKDWITVFNVLVVVSLIISMLAVIIPMPIDPTSLTRYNMEYGTRVHSTIGNPTFLASYLLLVSFICLILTFNARNKYLKGLYLFSILLHGVVIYLTATRAVILSVIIVTTVLSAFYITKRIKAGIINLKHTTLSFFILLITLSGIVWIINDAEIIKQDRTLSRFTTMLTDVSVSSRLNAWSMAWEGIKERPVLGWGQENFISLYSLVRIPIVREQMWLDRAHNIIIEWLVNAGILGLLSYISIFGAAFYSLRKGFIKESLPGFEVTIVASALVAYFIQNLFSFDTINSYMIFFTLLAYIDNRSTMEGRASKSATIDTVSVNNRLRYVGAVILVLLSAGPVIYYLNYKPIKQSQMSMEISINFPQSESFETVLNDFRKSLSYQTFGDEDLRERMLFVSRFIINNKLFHEKGALEFLQETADELHKGLEFSKEDLEYLTDLIEFYHSMAPYNPSSIIVAEHLIEKSLQTNPEYEYPYMIWADLYLLRKDYERSYEIVKGIVDRDPENDKLQLKLAYAAIFTSREDILNSSIEKIESIRKLNNNNIASGIESLFSISELYEFATVYKEKEKYHKVAEYYEKILNLLADNNEFRSSRDLYFYRYKRKGKMYFEAAEAFNVIGRKGKAEEYALKALEIDPGYSERVDKLMKSIN